MGGPFSFHDCQSAVSISPQPSFDFVSFPPCLHSNLDVASQLHVERVRCHCNATATESNCISRIFERLRENYLLTRDLITSIVFDMSTEVSEIQNYMEHAKMSEFRLNVGSVMIYSNS